MNLEAAASDFQLLFKALEGQEKGISEYLKSPEEVYDDKADVKSPVFDSFFSSNGRKGVREMKKFTFAEFRIIWNTI